MYVVYLYLGKIILYCLYLILFLNNLLRQINWLLCGPIYLYSFLFFFICMFLCFFLFLLLFIYHKFLLMFFIIIFLNTLETTITCIFNFSTIWNLFLLQARVIFVCGNEITEYSSRQLPFYECNERFVIITMRKFVDLEGT